MPKLPSIQGLREFESYFGEASEILKRLAFRLFFLPSSLYGLYHLARVFFR
jgi:hypothetical protein